MWRVCAVAATAAASLGLSGNRAAADGGDGGGGGDVAAVGDAMFQPPMAMAAGATVSRASLSTNSA